MREDVKTTSECGMYVLTHEGWKPAKFIEYEPPNPPLWAKPLIWLFDKWQAYKTHRKEASHE